MRLSQGVNDKSGGCWKVAMNRFQGYSDRNVVGKQAFGAREGVLDIERPQGIGFFGEAVDGARVV